MWLYFIIFLVPIISYFSSRRRFNQNNKRNLAIYFIFLAFFVGISDMLGGYDRYIYGEIFDGIADITTIKGNYLSSYEFTFYASEIGYSLLNVLISFVTANRYIFILIVTLIIYSLLYVSISRYSENYPFAVIIFMALWFFFTFTYLRQVLGATVAWLGIQYVYERKLWKFLLVWLIAFSFHNSAIIFLPIYFIPIRKYSKRTVIRLMLALLVLGLSPLPNILFESYGEASIVERGNEYNSAGAFRVEYLLEAAFFLYVILIKYHEIPSEKKNIVLLNMSLVFCAILLFFIRSENGGRLGWYYMIGIISTLTYLTTYKKQIPKFAFSLVIIFFLLYIRIILSWGVLLTPYKTFLTNGTRKGDFIYQRYEYNYNYANDKLYRDAVRFEPNLSLNFE